MISELRGQRLWLCLFFPRAWPSHLAQTRTVLEKRVCSPFSVLYQLFPNKVSIMQTDLIALDRALLSNTPPENNRRGKRSACMWIFTPFKLMCILIIYDQAFSLITQWIKIWMLPFFLTVLACCVRKAASTVFHPTLSHSRSLRIAHVVFPPPMTNAKRNRTNFAATYFKETDQKKSREWGTPVSSPVMVFFWVALYDFCTTNRNIRHVATEYEIF